MALIRAGISRVVLPMVQNNHGSSVKSGSSSEHTAVHRIGRAFDLEDKYILFNGPQWPQIWRIK